MALRLRSSRRSSFGRNIDRFTQRSTDDQETVRPTQLALDQVSSMLTPLRNAHAWLQERTAPPSIEDQLQESGLVIESDESIHDEQDLDESSNKSHGPQQSSDPRLSNVTIRTQERKHSPTQGEPISSTKDEPGNQEKPPTHDGSSHKAKQNHLKSVIRFFDENFPFKKDYYNPGAADTELNSFALLYSRDANQIRGLWDWDQQRTTCKHSHVSL